jgi:hypothetical protein
MADLKREDDEFLVEKLAQHPIVADAVAPNPRPITDETFAAATWVIETRRFIEVIDDPSGDLPIEFAELA